MFHLLGIERFAVAMSIATLTGAFQVHGAPHLPSYIPGSMAQFGDRMTFWQRLQNTISHGLLYFILTQIQAKANPIFNELVPGFEVDDIAKASLYVVNNNPLADFPTVITHKVVAVGGITVQGGNQTLSKEWNDILNLRKYSILLSFGSGARSADMPQQWKTAMKEAFRRIPEVTFIWKYEEPSHKLSADVDNIVETTWMPQRQLLKDGRLTAFMTHGGAGSTMEATHAGTPLIVIPLMGDQFRNAALIDRLGTGIQLRKEHLTSADKIEKLIRRLISDDRISSKAKLVAAQLRDQPFQPKEQFVRNMEFLARYGPLTQLDHYGTQLNFLQYYLVDVFAFLTLVLLTILTISFLVIRFIIRKLLGLFCVKSASSHSGSSEETASQTKTPLLTKKNE
ncbi:hypothetical protein WR25_13132 isoform C [Diploscapter pachys]|uniref:glucuronosyltransferase n=1 Tax=Diploscapter pachys TaxID=2018661 RepID=A0A2A2LQF3_9BILA|nr:hypothetical protein WR25_13132 isoform A [Diploscapter pachys]PAV88265.1 hypothetical protein WR25_13132 isoform C [Diploscapter pachys]